MDNLRDNYRDDDDEDDEYSRHPQATLATTVFDAVTDFPITINGVKEETGSEDSDEVSDDENDDEIFQTPKATPIDDEDEDDEEHPRKKHKSLSTLSSKSSKEKTKSKNGKKGSSSKKKNNNVWTKPSSRKGKKKGKSSTNGNSNVNVIGNGNINNMNSEDRVMITPIPKFIDKTDDTPEMKICLSKVYKAEKVELSDDRMCASSCKGYRMVRTTRGVIEGAWYFEIRVLRLGETGHTRLGWSMEKGDLQAPVGYDANSFGYRDVDGSKVHKALREKYGEGGYLEGDVIGFYINLPEGSLYLPKPPHLVWYRGQRYMCAPDVKEDPPKVIPGSEISFFKNGVCQGVAFKDLYGGRYYPAASMYTLPDQPNCIVRFNFGPDFECFPEDLNDRPLPRPMIEAPYHGGVETRLENGDATENKP